MLKWPVTVCSLLWSMGWSCQDCVNSDLWVGVQDCMICGLEVRICDPVNAPAKITKAGQRLRNVF